jgi:hypothetical protein
MPKRDDLLKEDADALLLRMSELSKEFAAYGNFAMIAIVYSPTAGIKLYTAAPTVEKDIEPPIILFLDMLDHSIDLMIEPPQSSQFHSVNKGKH